MENNVKDTVRTLLRIKETYLFLIAFFLLFIIIIFIISLNLNNTSQLSSSPTPTVVPENQSSNPQGNIIQINPRIVIYPSNPTIPSGNFFTFTVTFPQETNPNLVSVTLVRTQNSTTITVPTTLTITGTSLKITTTEKILPQYTYNLFVREKDNNLPLISAQYISQ